MNDERSNHRAADSAAQSNKSWSEIGHQLLLGGVGILAGFILIFTWYAPELLAANRTIAKTERQSPEETVARRKDSR